MDIEKSKKENENLLNVSKNKKNINNSFENTNKNNSYNCSNNLNNNFNNNNKEREIYPKNLNCTKSFMGHDDKVVSLIQLKSGYIATGSYDLSIRIWDIESRNCIIKLYDFGYILCLLEFEPNFLLTGTSENNIALFNLNEPDKGSIFNFNKHSLWVNCLVKCDETYFASASNDSFIFIWNYNTKEFERALEGHKDCILTLIKLNNGYLCSGSADEKIRIWNWKIGNVLYELNNGDWVRCLYQLKNGNILSGCSNKNIKIWNNEYQCINTLFGHEHSVRSFCQIDDNYFASASFDNTIKIWDINTLENVNTLKMHQSNVICIIKLKDNRLASCSTDKTIRIWE
jgi:WD40 repeat protein